MIKYVLIKSLEIGLLGMCSCSPHKIQHLYLKDDGEFYARSRIVVGNEKEWAKSKSCPTKYHSFDVVKNSDLNYLMTMQNCVSIYVDDGNLAGIRGVFLNAYFLASIPCRSGDVLTSYGDPIRALKKSLGDKQFAFCLDKMRPEVQSAVLYLLYFTYWPLPGEDEDFDVRSESREPYTFALSKKVTRLKWPADYEE